MKTTNIRSYIELLEVFYIGLTNGLIEKEAVIMWADSIIQQDDEPDHFVIELSLCGQKNVNDIVSLISEFVGEPSPAVSGRVILGFIYRQYVKKIIPLKKVTSTIDWLTWQNELSETEKGFMYGLDDALYCAESGIYGTVEAVEKETLRFLEIYQEFNIDNFNNWDEIDKTIDEKVKHLSEMIDAENEKRREEWEKKKKVKWWEFWKF